MLPSLFFDCGFNSLHVTDFLDLESLWCLTQVSRQFRKIKHNVSTADVGDAVYLIEDTAANPSALFKFPFDYTQPIKLCKSDLLELSQFKSKLMLRKCREKFCGYSVNFGVEFLDFFRKPFAFLKLSISGMKFARDIYIHSHIAIDVLDLFACDNIHFLPFHDFRNVHTINFNWCLFTENFATIFPHPATRKLSFTNCEFKFPIVITEIISSSLHSLSFVNCVFKHPVHFHAMFAPHLKEVLIENCPQMIIQDIVVINNKRKYE